MPTGEHAVCPECHTHQQTLPDGRIAEHFAVNDVEAGRRCPGSEDWPNRAAGTSRYDITSQFASCPAATGPSQCTHFPDGAHRCEGARDHYTTDIRRADERTHRCTCGEEWTALMGSIGSLFKTVLKPSEQITAKLISEYVEGAEHGSGRKTGWPYERYGPAPTPTNKETP
jgi:hypothetical protein